MSNSDFGSYSKAVVTEVIECLPYLREAELLSKILIQKMDHLVMAKQEKLSFVMGVCKCHFASSHKAFMTTGFRDISVS